MGEYKNKIKQQSFWKTIENLNIPHAKVQNGKAEKKKRKMNKRKKENKINILSFIFYMTDWHIHRNYKAMKNKTSS